MKKKLIRIFTVVLALTMIFALTACKAENAPDDEQLSPEEKVEKEVSPYSLYTKASKAMQDAKDLSMVINMSVSGGTEDMSMNGPVQAIMTSETEREMLMTLNVTMMGQEIPMTMYYKEGFAYFEMMGRKFKQPMGSEQASAQANVGRVEFPEDAIKNQSMKEIPSGTELSFTIDGSKMEGIVSGSLGGMDKLFGDMSFEYGDLTIVATLDTQENLTGMSLNAEVSSTADATQRGLITIAMTDIQLGGVVITAPPDLESYPEGLS